MQHRIYITAVFGLWNNSLLKEIKRAFIFKCSGKWMNIKWPYIFLSVDRGINPPHPPPPRKKNEKTRKERRFCKNALTAFMQWSVLLLVETSMGIFKINFLDIIFPHCKGKTTAELRDKKKQVLSSFVQMLIFYYAYIWKPITCIFLTFTIQ